MSTVFPLFLGLTIGKDTKVLLLKCEIRRLVWDDCRFSVFNDGVSVVVGCCGCGGGGGGGGGGDSINSNSIKNLRPNKNLRTLHEGYSARNSEVGQLLIGTVPLCYGNVLNTLNKLDSQHNNYLFSNNSVLLLHVSAFVHNHSQVFDS